MHACIHTLLSIIYHTLADYARHSSEAEDPLVKQKIWPLVLAISTFWVVLSTIKKVGKPGRRPEAPPADCPRLERQSANSWTL